MSTGGFQSRRVSREALDRDPSACCVLDAALDFLYCNPAWDEFAEANGGGPDVRAEALLGLNLLTFIPPVLRSYFHLHLRTALSGVSVWLHDYECSSPDLYRVYRLHAYALTDRQELLLVHTLQRQRAHTRHVIQVGKDYSEDTGIAMCSHCRKTCRGSRPGVWEWIPEYLRSRPATVRTSLCERCYNYYFGDVPPWNEEA